MLSTFCVGFAKNVDRPWKTYRYVKRKRASRANPSHWEGRKSSAKKSSKGRFFGLKTLSPRVVAISSDENGVFWVFPSKKPHVRGVPQNLGIGKNCKINKAIIDKNAHIGNNCCININGKTYEDGDHGLFYSSDGIIVIRKGAVIPDGTVI